jgi:hypothetical protein
VIICGLAISPTTNRRATVTCRLRAGLRTYGPNAQRGKKPEARRRKRVMTRFFRHRVLAKAISLKCKRETWRLTPRTPRLLQGDHG